MPMKIDRLADKHGIKPIWNCISKTGDYPPNGKPKWLYVGRVSKEKDLPIRMSPHHF
jgi:hypothetical protein